MTDYITAMYLRLSLDDAKSDSMSIENQRMIAHKHIASLDLPDGKVVEFVDNGYSGLNFERPAVQELLELVRAGKVNCIIVKDFSRFGRNVIDMGYFMERIFPLFRVRFIAVTDNYDSATLDGNTGGMEVAFKFLIHEYYSRDLSVKIKNAKRMRALRGEYIMKSCIFGYKKVGKSMEIDEPAAVVVRLIFDMAAQGSGLSDIAARLYADKHPTPNEHKRQVTNGSASDPKCIWNASVLQAMLANEQYTGTYISGMSRTVEIGSGRSIKVDESEWIKIPGHHPAIVSREVFEAVRERANERKDQRSVNSRTNTSKRYTKNDSPLYGKVYCGYCGYSMRLSSTKNAAFHCHHTRAATDADCHKMKMLRSELESESLGSIIARSHAILAGISDAPPRLDGHEGRLLQLCNDKRDIYEKHILGEITADEYKAKKEVIDSECHKLKHALDKFKKENAEWSRLEGRRTIAEEVLKDRTLSRHVVDALVEKVLVYQDGKSEISWKQEQASSILDAVSVI